MKCIWLEGIFCLASLDFPQGLLHSCKSTDCLNSAKSGSKTQGAKQAHGNSLEPSPLVFQDYSYTCKLNWTTRAIRDIQSLSWASNHKTSPKRFEALTNQESNSATLPSPLLDSCIAGYGYHATTVNCSTKHKFKVHRPNNIMEPQE